MVALKSIRYQPGMKNWSWLIGATVGAVLTSSYFAYAALGGTSGIRIPYSGVLEQNGVLVSGEVDLTFGLWNAESGGVSPCYSSGAIPTTLSSGRFAVVIGPVTPESCVAGKDVWLDVTVDTGGGAVLLPGRQRIHPAVAAVSSGTGDFDVGGNLSVTGAAQLGTLTVAGATQLGLPDGGTPTTVNGDLTVTGNTILGLYSKACFYNDVGGSDVCYCNNNDRVLSGGLDCDYGGGTYAISYSHAFNSGAWYGLCENVTTDGAQSVDPVRNEIICARVR
jgi:hypothetical protein